MHILDRVDPEQIRAFHERGEFFWLDLEAPTERDIDALADVLGLPPLAAEDSKEFNQRPKIDDYGDRLLIVFYAAHGRPDDAELFEIHLHLSERELVTVRREPCAPLMAARAARVHTEHEIFYKVLDSLSESTLAHVRGIEQEAIRLEQRAFEGPTTDDRRRITRMRGQLFRLLQVIVPQKDMLAQNTEAIERVLGMESGQARHPIYDIRDDLVLAANIMAYGREILGEALNVYLQATSNRLNQIGTRLTLMATIFIPLTLITGFFGQNFGWLVHHIDSFTAFAVWGVGGMVVPTAGILLWLGWSGYLNSDGQ